MINWKEYESGNVLLKGNTCQCRLTVRISNLWAMIWTQYLLKNKKSRVKAVLRRSSRISRKERIQNVTIRQQIGLEEPIIKETEQNQLTWYGHVQRMAEGRLPKIALKWTPKQKRARGRPKKNWMKDIRKAMNERNLNEGQWGERKQWSLGFGQRRMTFQNRFIHTSPENKAGWPHLKCDVWLQVRDMFHGVL